MKELNFSLYIVFICGLLFFNSCKDEDPIVVKPPEIITTVIYTLTPMSGDVVTLSFIDNDGDGGNDPIISGGTLSANTIYTGTLELKNESVTPVEDITEEIVEEAADHQFFFSTTGGLNATVSYTDTDADGNPIGLETSIVTTDASSGTLTVILRHEPNKSGSGVDGGDITNAGGETDIEVTFPVDIQ